MSDDDLTALLEDDFFAENSPRSVGMKALGIVLAILVLVLYLLCCWQAWCCCYPLCRKGGIICCHRRDDHPCGKMKKGLFVLILAGFVLCVAAVSFVGFSYGGQLAAGQQRMFCSGATMVDATLSGAKGAPELGGSNFVGVIGGLESIEDIVNTLEPDTDFVKDARAIISDTADLEKTVTALKTLLQATTDITTLTDNVSPDGFHVNLLAYRLGEIVSQATAGMDESFATVLNEARAQTAEVLNDDNLAKMKEDMPSGAITEIRAMTDSLMESAFKRVTGEDSQAMKENLDQIFKYFSLGVQGFMGLALLLALLAIVCVILLIFRDKLDVETGRNPYPTINSKITACAWCYGVLVTILCLIVGGALQLLMWPTGGVCITLLDMDETSLDKWNFLDVGESSDMMNTCLFGDGDMLGSVPKTDPDTGEETTMGEWILSQINGKIDAAFEPLTDDSLAPDADISGIAELIKAIRVTVNAGVPLETFITLSPIEPSVDADRITNFLAQSEYAAAQYDPRYAAAGPCDSAKPDMSGSGSALTQGLVYNPVAGCVSTMRWLSTSAACSDYIVSSVAAGPFETPILQGAELSEAALPDTVDGLDDVISAINSYPSQTVTSVACTTSEFTENISPDCAPNDEGLCMAICASSGNTGDDLTKCAGICSGSIADDGTYATLCPTCATLGTDNVLRATHCPANAALRIGNLRRLLATEARYKCPRMVCGGVQCGPGAWNAPGCSFDRDVDKIPKTCIKATVDAGITTYSIEMVPGGVDCTLSEFQAFLEDVGLDIDAAAAKLSNDVANTVTRIETELKDLIYAELVDPVADLLVGDALNCGYLGAAWTNFREGACYELAGAIGSQGSVIIAEGMLCLLLTFLLFGLWRYLVDNRVAWNELNAEPKSGTLVGARGVAPT